MAVNFWTPIVETISEQLKYESRSNAVEYIKIMGDIGKIVGYIESKLL